MLLNATKIVLAISLVLLSACAAYRYPNKVLLKQQILVDNFESGDDVVPDADKENVVKMAQQILDMGPYAVVYLIGNTDDVGAERGNIGLSYQRAHNVADILVGEGVNRDRIVLLAEGDYQPIESNDTNIDKAHNRRVDIEVRCSFHY